MLRISAVFALLTLIETTANVSAAQPQKPSGAKACSQEEFMVNCRKRGYNKCDYWWQREQSMGGSCLR
jgi:invasion protein IalB